MALSALQKLLRKPPQTTATIIASLNNSQHLLSQAPPTPSTLHNQIPQFEPKTTGNCTVKDCTFLDQLKSPNSTHFDLSIFSPISPIGLFSYPILTTGSVLDRPEEGDGSSLWADSVKKKRKKKMNKHKYKKLRKRLRRQS